MNLVQEYFVLVNEVVSYRETVYIMVPPQKYTIAK